MVALTHTYSGKLPADLVRVESRSLLFHPVALSLPFPSLLSPQTSPVPSPLPFPTSPRLRVLRRCNIFLTDSASNFRIPQLQQHYDLIAARPTDERTLQQACQSLDIDIISLDLTRKFEKHFKFPMLGSALARGIKIELCYSQGIMSNDPLAKRNLISNATQLIRVTRGKGLIFSSEAKTVLGIRAPSDVINLASVWGLGNERGKDGLTKEPRSVVEFARLKRQSFKGIIDFVHGGDRPTEKPAAELKNQPGQKVKANKNPNGKRPGDSLEGTPDDKFHGDKPVSKRQQKANKMERAAVKTKDTS